MPALGEDGEVIKNRVLDRKSLEEVRAGAAAAQTPTQS
jgi:hypothetical protein